MTDRPGQDLFARSVRERQARGNDDAVVILPYLTEDEHVRLVELVKAAGRADDESLLNKLKNGWTYR